MANGFGQGSCKAVASGSLWPSCQSFAPLPCLGLFATCWHLLGFEKVARGLLRRDKEVVFTRTLSVANGRLGVVHRPIRKAVRVVGARIRTIYGRQRLQKLLAFKCLQVPENN